MARERKLGPRAKELLAVFVAREAIPDGGGIGDGVKFFTDRDHMRKVMDCAMANFDLAITAVRAAPDNPYGDDEEAIAAAVLARLAERRKEHGNDGQVRS